MQKITLLLVLLLGFSCGPKEIYKEHDSIINIKGNYTFYHTIVNKNACKEEKEYYVKICSPFDEDTPRHFREKKYLKDGEFLLLNFLNLHDYYIIKGIASDSLIYINGYLRELIDKKNVVGGTLNIITKDSIMAKITIRSHDRINDHFKFENEILHEGYLIKQ